MFTVTVDIISLIFISDESEASKKNRNSSFFYVATQFVVSEVKL